MFLLKNKFVILEPLHAKITHDELSRVGHLFTFRPAPLPHVPTDCELGNIVKFTDRDHRPQRLTSDMQADITSLVAVARKSPRNFCTRP